jgi:hypothetical protein
MTSPQSPSGPTQHNHQHNHATRRGQVIANQGSGNQVVHLHNAAARKRTGAAVLVFLALDVVFFFYGMLAYTGHDGNSGDLWRAGIYVVMLGITVNLIRRWFRRRV